MKYPTKFFTRTGLPVRRNKREPQPEPLPNLGPLPPTEKELREAQVQGNYKPLDSWEPRHRLDAELPQSPPPSPAHLPSPAREEKTDEGPEITTTPREIKNRKKVRYMNVNISVSPEEKQLLRQHAAKLGMPFSEWARATLFRSMGRKVPARPKRTWED